MGQELDAEEMQAVANNLSGDFNWICTVATTIKVGQAAKKIGPTSGMISGRVLLVRAVASISPGLGMLSCPTPRISSRVFTFAGPGRSSSYL
jgi:hypothetical protein